MQIRKNHLSFALTISDTELVFESNPDEVPFINALMFETIVNIHQELENLKGLVKPEEFQRQHLADTENNSVKNNKSFQRTLADALDKKAIICDLKATDKTGVIRELVQSLADTGKISDPEKCFNDVAIREEAASTCLQNGIVLPHCRTTCAAKLAVAIGIKREGYLFDSIDGKPSRIFPAEGAVFLLLSRRGNFGL